MPVPLAGSDRAWEAWTLRVLAALVADARFNSARLLGAETRDAAPEDAGEIEADAIIAILRRVGMPRGLAKIRFGPDEVDAVVAGALPQQRVTKLSSRPASAAELRALFLGAMRYW